MCIRQNAEINMLSQLRDEVKQLKNNVKEDMYIAILSKESHFYQQFGQNFFASI